MYRPDAFALESRNEILDVLRRTAFGHLVTHGDELATEAGLTATALPFVVDDELSSVRAHVARANRQWRSIDGGDALLIVASADAYISPRWYASRDEHGRVVPTWNYELVHVRGTVEIHHAAAWKRAVVTDLTRHNERRVSGFDRSRAWEVADAPAEFIDAQLGAIVGVELHVTSTEAKRKLSQNRPAADRAGAAEGLVGSDRRRDLDTADLMRSLDPG